MLPEFHRAALEGLAVSAIQVIKIQVIMLWIGQTKQETQTWHPNLKLFQLQDPTV